MIGRLNHVAIAVPDIDAAANTYRNSLGASISEKVDQPDHGVTTIFIELPNTKIELLEPLGEDSPITKFLERNPNGGIHHICYEVDDIITARDKLLKRAHAFSAAVTLKSAPTANLFCFCTQKTSAAHWSSSSKPDSVHQANNLKKDTPMSTSLALATYFICWWLALFMVLPWGVRTQEEEGDIVPGSPESAPQNPHIFKNFIATTIVLASFFGLVYLAYSNDIVNIDENPLPANLTTPLDKKRQFGAAAQLKSK